MHAISIALDGQMEGSYAIYKDISEQVKTAAQARDHSESLNRLVNELQLRTTQMTLLNEMGDLLQCSSSSMEGTCNRRADGKKTPGSFHRWCALRI